MSLIDLALIGLSSQEREALDMKTIEETRLPGPLAGVRIVECAVWHAGPGASAILADMGAEVIKVETLAGDPERSQVSLGALDFASIDDPEWSFLFELSNRNKKGICLDINTAKGREIFTRLIETADVFLTNLRKTTKPKLGIDYASIAALNPRIVHANVSGFGPEGAMSDVGAFDPMGQAISGMVFLTGPDEPVLLQSVILDQMTAIAASHAILSALFVRERHGTGQEVHVSLYGSAIWLMHSNMLAAGIFKENPMTQWDRSRNSPLRNCFKCSDGKWLMGTNHPEQKFWPQFCRVTEQPQLEHDRRYATLQARAEHAPELVEFYDQLFMSRTRDEWIELLQSAGLMFAPVQHLDEVLRDPQALANDYIVDFEHPRLGSIKMPGYPVQFSANDAGTHAPAPRLGEHTQLVLADLGYSAEQFEQLRQEQVVK